MKRIFNLSALIILLVTLFVFSNSCARVSNSFSGDASLIVSPELRPIVRVMNAYDCLQCHAVYSAYQTSQAWADAGLIVPGDAANSKLVKRLRGTPTYMPPSGSTVDEASIQDIEDWIAGI